MGGVFVVVFSKKINIDLAFCFYIPSLQGILFSLVIVSTKVQMAIKKSA
jgi:hypothetical protein